MCVFHTAKVSTNVEQHIRGEEFDHHLSVAGRILDTVLQP